MSRGMPGTMRQLALDIGLAPVPTLDNFVPVGNEAAVEHLRLWVSNPLRSPVPTCLWGESGSGKTHLLQAVREALREQGARVGWMDAGSLYPPEFDDAWEVVLLDDVHLYTAGQQAVAFNWFVNAQAPAHGRARWVLASADRPPADLPLREDLRTRLGWGHVFRLVVLGESERRSVLRRAADERGIFLADEVMDYMLNRFSRDLSSLMMLLDRLDAYALRTQRAITIPLMRSMLEDE
jgi:DnaA family protein